MPTFSPTDPYRPLFSTLSDQKSALLTQKYAEKKQNQNPTPPPTESLAGYSLDFENGNTPSSDNTNAIDLAQASLVRGVGNIGAGAGEISNRVFNTNFDTTDKSGLNNQAVADEIAGVSPEYRKQYEADLEKIPVSLANENYWQVVKDSANVAVRAAADSAATLPEVAVGSAITALSSGIAGPAIFGKKIKSAVDTAEKAKEIYDKAKKYKEANRLGKLIQKAPELPAIAAKASGQVGLMVLDFNQQAINNYREKYKKDPSNAWVASSALGTLVTNIVEPAIITKLFIPSVKKEYISEIGNLIRNMGEGSNLVNIVKRAAKGAEAIAKAGAAEGLQEYIQTWQEAIQLNTTPETSDNLLKLLVSSIKDPKLQIQAATGGLVGGFAGGVTRAGITAPTIAAGTAIDLTKATVKGTANTVASGVKAAGSASQDFAVRQGLKVINQEERDIIVNDYNNRKEVVDREIANRMDKAKTVNTATSYEELLVDDKIAKTANDIREKYNIPTEDLSDSKNFDKFKKRIINKYEEDQRILKAELATSTIAKAAKQIGKNIVTNTVDLSKDAAKYIDENVPVDKIVEQVKDAGAVTINAIKEIRSSTALGIIDLAFKGGTENTKTALKLAKELKTADLQRVALAIKAKNPEAGRYLERFAEKRTGFLESTGQRSKTVFNKDTLPKAIKDIVETGKVTSKTAAHDAKILNKVLAGRIENKETLATVKSALGIYEQSDAYKNQEPGALDSISLNALKYKLEGATNRLNRNPTAENIKNVIDTVSEKVKPVVDESVKYAKKKAKELKDKVSEANKQRRLNNAAKVSPEEVIKVQAAIDDEIKQAEEAQIAADKLAKEKEITVPEETITQKAKTVFSDVVKGAAKAIVNFDKKLNREVKVLPETSKFNKFFKTIESSLEDPVTAEGSINNIKGITDVANKAGYTTLQDLADLAKQFPGIEKNEIFYAKLVSEFSTDVIIDQDNNTEDDPVSDAINVFKNVFKLTGCKK